MMELFSTYEWITAAVASLALVISALSALYARASVDAAKRSAAAAEESAKATKRQADVAERTAQITDRAASTTLFRARATFHTAAEHVLGKIERIRRIVGESNRDQPFSGSTISVEELRELKVLALDANIALDLDPNAVRDAMQPFLVQGQPLFRLSTREHDLRSLDSIISALRDAIAASA